MSQPSDCQVNFRDLFLGATKTLGWLSGLFNSNHHNPDISSSALQLLKGSKALDDHCSTAAKYLVKKNPKKPPTTTPTLTSRTETFAAVPSPPPFPGKIATSGNSAQFLPSSFEKNPLQGVMAEHKESRAKLAQPAEETRLLTCNWWGHCACHAINK